MTTADTVLFQSLLQTRQERLMEAYGEAAFERAKAELFDDPRLRDFLAAPKGDNGKASLWEQFAEAIKHRFLEIGLEMASDPVPVNIASDLLTPVTLNDGLNISRADLEEATDVVIEYADKLKAGGYENGPALH